MIDITTREFTRNFSRYRAKAASGESIRIASADGTFIFHKEPRGLPAGDFLRRTQEKKALFDIDPMGPGGFAHGSPNPAKSPWD